MQLADDGLKASVGQAPELPVHFSSTSHWPAEPRQTVLLDLKTSTQVLLVPVQWSVLSHASPCEAPVQVVPLEAKASAGHAPELPVQLSATSHCPAEARHVKPAAWKTSTHVLLVPVQ